MDAGAVTKAKEEFLKIALEEFNADPGSKDLLQYITSHFEEAVKLHQTIHRYVKGDSGITIESIEQCKQDILKLGQIAHVIKTMPATKTEYRKHIGNEMRNMVEGAIEDYYVILNWTRFGGERRL